MRRSKSPHSNTAVLILAAGESKRLGQSKLSLVLDGETLLRRSLKLAQALHPYRIFITLGAGAEQHWSSIAAHGSAMPLPERIDVLDHASGMAASIRAGARLAALDQSIARMIVLLVDQWRLELAHLRALLAGSDQYPKQIIASRYQPRPTEVEVQGSPAVFPRARFADLAELQGDRGARELLRIGNEVCAIACGPPGDIDSMADWEQAIAASAHTAPR